jgi:hypothetical protein
MPGAEQNRQMSNEVKNLFDLCNIVAKINFLSLFCNNVAIVCGVKFNKIHTFENAIKHRHYIRSASN